MISPCKLGEGEREPALMGFCIYFVLDSLIILQLSSGSDWLLAAAIFILIMATNH